MVELLAPFVFFADIYFGKSFLPVYEINRHVIEHYKGEMEGSMNRQFRKFFEVYLKKNSFIKTIAEIGFNRGHGSMTFLSTREDISVVSFDIGIHPLHYAKEFIDQRFPGRHELVIGDSTQTVSKYAKEHAEQKFDLIFIDGGHEYDVALKDIENMKSMSHSETVVIMDDLMPWRSFGKGPFLAWKEANNRKLVQEISIWADLGKNYKQIPSHPRLSSEKNYQHVWAVGFYK